MPSPAQARTIYLLKLDGPLSTPAKVQAAAKLQAISESHVRSSDDDGNKSLFCKLDGRAELAIESWLSARNEEFRPLFVTLGRAYEELSSSSLYPTLGIYTILLQFRPQDAHLLVHAPTFGYAQDQFPVWYFYGRLASAPKLCSLLSLPGDEVPVLHKPSAMGGKMETGGNGKYNALVYGPEIVSRINGWAYQVASEEHEDALRKYETAAYEVFKCEMEMHSNRVQGCISRFVGECVRWQINPYDESVWTFKNPTSTIPILTATHWIETGEIRNPNKQFQASARNCGWTTRPCLFRGLV
ncbi:uncharacterized protein L3040_004574 [Drepanopeziza brunnea f. sp. 'multigermtubi']|uniref:uncharacterized protein n=1 Tax=Drepanopeziza brunnea f. sp. 'multigermtubi' TaxID=698441 RepID=UPI0023A4E3B1|nr:hypothetical protein L3040_004574 [Drepanopeziza brunnea f. sp. 'multigermtubi']